jgi:SpoVK/Ycf46/Vps4 family AAA+-type ATPase
MKEEIKEQIIEIVAPEFKLGETIYKAGFDRCYYGLFVEKVEIESFLFKYPKGPTTIMWEFGNIASHKREIQKYGKIRIHKPSDCVKTINEAQEKLIIILNEINAELDKSKKDSVENIEGLKQILKEEIKESLERSRAYNKIINQYKRIDLESVFIKKITNNNY